MNNTCLLLDMTPTTLSHQLFYPPTTLPRTCTPNDVPPNGVAPQRRGPPLPVRFFSPITDGQSENKQPDDDDDDAEKTDRSINQLLTASFMRRPVENTVPVRGDVVNPPPPV